MVGGKSDIWSIAEADPARTAIIEADGSTLTFGALVDLADRMVVSMRDAGVITGDVVASLQTNRASAVAAYFAAVRAGCYFTPLNTRWTRSELQYVLDDSGATALIVDERTVHALGGDADELPHGAVRWRGATRRIDGWIDLCSLSPLDGPLRPSAAVGDRMHYTSGTTGRPKGVRRPLGTSTPAAAARRMLADAEDFGLHERPVHLVLGPLSHAAPLNFTVLALHLGGTVVLTEGWDSLDVLDRIASYRVTSTHMVPTMFERLLALPDHVRSSADVSSLRAVMHAAAPCPPATKRAMIEWFGPVLYEYYGATEGGGTVVNTQEWLLRPGTVGRARRGARIEIRRDGRSCAAGETGDVHIAPAGGPFVYHGDPEKTAAAWCGDAFTVGDVGHLDDEGYLFLTGRTAEVIIRGGVNIYPAEIEAVLIGHPSVADVAVAGVPDAHWGESVHAMVELIPGSTVGPDQLLADLRARCDAELATYKHPTSIEIVTSLPREPSGKLFRRRLALPKGAQT